MSKKIFFALTSAILCVFAVAAADGTSAPDATKVPCPANEQASFTASHLTADVLEAALDPAAAGEDLVCAPQPEAVDPATSLWSLGLPVEDLADRLAICRLMPECWTNAECDAQCGGAGLGRCAHSRCPVRVCRCK